MKKKNEWEQIKDSSWDKIKVKKEKKEREKMRHVACGEESRKVGRKLPFWDNSMDKGKRKGKKGKREKRRKRIERERKGGFHILSKIYKN